MSWDPGLGDDRRVLEYLIINWRTNLVTMYSSHAGDADLLTRAINRCSIILSMLKSSGEAEGRRFEPVGGSIVSQLALLVSEIERLAENAEGGTRISI